MKMNLKNRTTKLGLAIILTPLLLTACNSSNDNAIPVANAGTDQVKRVGSIVNLNGNDSFDSDGSITNYSWTQVSGTSVTLSDSSTASPSFTAPDTAEVLSFELTVTDNVELTNTDTVDIVVKGNTAIFLNPAYVDYVDGDIGSEAYNLLQTIPAYGEPITTFTGITAADFSSNTSSTTLALIIPELEMGDLNPDINDAARTVISDYVNNGGILVTFGSTDLPTFNLLNATFGWSLESGSENGTYSLNSTAATGTSFAGGPTPLVYNDDTTTVLLSSLPAEAKAIYVDNTSGDAALFAIPVGSGYVVYSGYDWYDGAPAGTQDNGWLDALNRALSLTETP